MVFSKATEYGIRALAYMARQDSEHLCVLSEIAAGENIPPIYLRKLLGELRRKRIVNSVKGIHGGYLLARDPRDVTLWEIFALLDSNPYLDECVLCHSDNHRRKCVFCSDWNRIGSELIGVLKKRTIADLAAGI